MLGLETMYVDPNGSSFATKLLRYLQEADYKLADSASERQEIYRLRYDAYRREGVIDENRSRMFYDAYDSFDNCWIFGVFLDEKLASSIRFHVLSPENRKGPALDVFPDIVSPMLDKGMTLIDPTRLVASVEASRKYPEISFMAMRIACMAYEYFNADYCLVTVRKEHVAFYKRVFKAKMFCEPRPYPLLKSPICLLCLDVRDFREEITRRYPIFESSFTERRMIFESRVQSGATDSPRLDQDIAVNG